MRAAATRRILAALMSEPIALVTGATDGIGRATALALARRGYYVIVHGRSAERVDAACAEISRTVKGAFVGACVADLSLYDEVHDAAALLLADNPHIDVLVNNAGVFLPERGTNPQGHELTLAVNHLGHFLLTHLLLPRLLAAPQGRVVNVSSMMHAAGRIDLDDLHLARGYSGRDAYASAKLANVLFTFELARRLEASPVTVNALHPGVIATKLLATGFGGLGGDSLAEGIRTTLHVATAPALATVTGRYFSREKEQRAAAVAYDTKLQRSFYERSAALVGVAAVDDAARGGL